MKGQPCRVVRLDKEYEERGIKLRTQASLIDSELQAVLQVHHICTVCIYI